MTPPQARRLHVLRENHRELHIGDARQRDWFVVGIWLAIIGLSAVILVLLGMGIGAAIHALRG